MTIQNFFLYAACLRTHSSLLKLAYFIPLFYVATTPPKCCPQLLTSFFTWICFLLCSWQNQLSHVLSKFPYIRMFLWRCFHSRCKVIFVVFINIFLCFICHSHFLQSIHCWSKSKNNDCTIPFNFRSLFFFFLVFFYLYFLFLFFLLLFAPYLRPPTPSMHHIFLFTCAVV